MFVANAANTKKRKAATPASWSPGQTGNPKGRPREGQSWATVLTWASNLTGAEAAEIAPAEMRREFRKLAGLQLKQAISLRIMAALLFDPDARLFNAVMDRVEGKVPQALDVSADWHIVLEKHGIDANLLFEQLVERLAAAGIGADDGSGDSGSVTPLLDVADALRQP